MSNFQNPNAIRRHLDLSQTDIKRCARDVDEEAISNAVTVLDGGGLGLLRNKVINRFAKEIKKADSESNTDIVLTDDTNLEGYQSKIDMAAAAAITTGMHTLNSLYGYQRIVKARATLFNVESIYEYDATGDWIQNLEDDRGRASHDRRMARIDLLSCGIGSYGGWVKTNVAGYQYDTFDPGKIWAIFGDEIYRDEKLSAVDRNDIDDASIVIIKLRGATADVLKSKFIAMYGASQKYPNGRQVIYESERWYDIPEVGDGGSDYVVSGEFVEYAQMGEVVNPLTQYRNQTKGKSQVEYPVFDWRMDSTADGTGVYPVSGTMLFELMRDIDAESSRNTESAGRSGRGAWFGDDPRALGFNQSISEGEGILKKEQDVKLLSHSASNAKDAMEVLYSNLQQIAGAHNVPPHLVAVMDSLNINSGFQLQVMNQPLNRDRNARAQFNTDEMSRKYNIEKALLNVQSKKDVIPVESKERWTPGPLEELRTPQEIRDDLDWQLDKGFLSTIQHMMKIRNLGSREEAIKALEEIKADNEQFGATPAVEEPAAPVGILSRRAAV